MTDDPLPQISVVVGTLNQADFIERTLLSVIEQRYPATELIVIDGASTDSTLDIIARYHKHIAFWVSEPDSGQHEAVNKGLRRATGDVVTWLCSDDTLAPGSLFRMGDCYRDHPDIDLVYGHTHLIDLEDRVTHRLVAVPTTASELIHYTRCMWSLPGTSWRRRLHDRIGFLDESLFCTADADFWIRAAKEGKIFCLPVHLGNLRQHPGTKSFRFSERFEIEERELDRRYGKRETRPLLRAGHRLSKILRSAARPTNWLYRFGLLDGRR